MEQSVKTTLRKRRLGIIALLAVLAGAGSAAWHYWQARWYATTDNAYLTGNLVEVSAQINGNVVWIGPEQNQAVARGQELLRMADGDEVETLMLRKGQLALAVQDVRTLRAEVDRLEAEQRLAAITHDLAQQEYARRQQLFPKNMVSKEELDTARTRSAETLVALETARLALDKARVRAGTQELTEHPMVMVAAARLRTAFRDWRKTRVISPVDGEIARRRVQAGQRIAAGTPLFTIVERHSAWIEANFKEPQLRHIRPGQPVEIRTELYGANLRMRGTVESIGTGTGSVFSLLPPQNATGNWIKIVQRVPVRIAPEQAFDRQHPLPFGASLHVQVDTHERGAPPMATAKPGAPVADADIYHYQDEGAEALVAQIIAENLN